MKKFYSSLLMCKSSIIYTNRSSRKCSWISKVFTLFIFLSFGLFNSEAIAQVTKITASSVKAASTSGYSSLAVLNASQAVDGNFDTKATLIGDAGTLAGIGRKESFLELEFSDTIPANTKLYVVLSEDGKGLLDYLVGGSIGSLVDGLVGALITGNVDFTITGKAGSTSVFSMDFNKDDVGGTSLVFGEDGRAYLPITTTGKIKSIRFDYEVNALAGLSTAKDSIHIHDVFYTTGTPLTCEAFYTTSYDAPGISLSLLTSIPEPVTNPHFAIDSIATNYSELGNQGVLTVSALQSFSQKVNFNHPSTEHEQVVIKYSMSDTNLLDLALLNSIIVKGYNGDTEVYSATLGSLLDLDLLGILNLTLVGGRPNVVTIPIDTTFTSVEVIYNQVITVGVASEPLKLYGVYKAPPKPQLDSNIVRVCDSIDHTIYLVDPIVDVVYTWYDKELNVVSTGTSFDFTTPKDGEADTFFVTAHYCENQKSEFVPLVVQGDKAVCATSAVVGFVDKSEYVSTMPIFAVLVNDTGMVVENAVVDYLGNYEFEEIEKGDYEVILVATTAPIPVGDTYTTATSNLGLSYIITPGTQDVIVDGSGDTANVAGFYVDYLGEPNIRTSITTSTSSVATGGTATLTYRIFNTSGRASNGTITCYIGKPSYGTLTLGTIPTGWTLSSTDTDYILTSNNPLSTGVAGAAVISATFVPSVTSPASQNFTITVPATMGADENIPYDNNATRNILINY